MKVIAGLFWLVSMAATAFAGISFLADFPRAESAPQQAAIAASALAMAGIPYVFARALHGLAVLASLGRRDAPESKS